MKAEVRPSGLVCTECGTPVQWVTNGLQQLLACPTCFPWDVVAGALGVDPAYPSTYGADVRPTADQNSVGVAAAPAGQKGESHSPR